MYDICDEWSSVRLSLTVCEKVMRLNMESPVEAFVCSAWISSRLTDPRTAFILSEVSRTKVMLQPRSPRISGISPARPNDILWCIYWSFMLDLTPTFKNNLISQRNWDKRTIYITFKM